MENTTTYNFLQILSTLAAVPHEARIVNVFGHRWLVTILQVGDSTNRTHNRGLMPPAPLHVDGSP